MPIAKRVHYWGKVQGVGFRYIAQGLASQRPVTGYVRNLLDGQVELVAEGDAADVERYLSALSARMADFIKGQTIENVTPQGFAEFEIRS